MPFFGVLSGILIALDPKLVLALFKGGGAERDEVRERLEGRDEVRERLEGQAAVVVGVMRRDGVSERAAYLSRRLSLRRRRTRRAQAMSEAGRGAEEAPKGAPMKNSNGDCHNRRASDHQNLL